MAKRKTLHIICFAENLVSQVDADGKYYKLFKEISSHCRKQNALADQFCSNNDGRQTQKKSAAGWVIVIE
jgi:hypothetical protein